MRGGEFYSHNDSTSLANATTAKNVVSVQIPTPGNYLVYGAINSTTTDTSCSAYMGFALSNTLKYESVNTGMNYGFNLSDMKVIEVESANSMISVTIRTSTNLTSGGVSGSITAIKL